MDLPESDETKAKGGWVDPRVEGQPEAIVDPRIEGSPESMELGKRYTRNKTERKKALLRDADDPASGLTETQREFIKKKKGENVPPGTEVSHDPPLYTVPAEQRSKLDKSDHMKTVPKDTHRDGHKTGGDQYDKYGPPSDYPWNKPKK